MFAVSLSSFDSNSTSFSFDLISDTWWLLRKLKAFSVIPTKWNHYCGELFTFSFCDQVKPILNTWTWNTRRAYSTSGTVLDLGHNSINFKWCCELLFCGCFEKKNSREVCCCLIYYSRSGWCCLAQYFYFCNLPISTG